MNNQPTSRPLFVYGTLRALPLLAWALTGDASNTSTVARLARPAKVYGYARYAVKNRDYPAVVKRTDESSTVDGYLLILETTSQRKKLDDFEGETYKVTAVTVELEDGRTVDGDMYVWDGNMADVSTEPWDLEAFVKERLEDWIDLFDGMELVGED
ncbi:putative gamma-glutamylcyclotransferase [Fusarium keratoplasticum]|uniref:Gamma-glutamylcyclotransferase n=1 Tax=Fusarium keratoplasticum TaxID=1328300 RepID=A0ACC0R2T8_9HYPO|nr:putative gamma-glutamylcyclotransferase [Fusarium keratoplasticum]KAI8674573.1 putative gamma-glutamylcyclotransferase [Fusarium keratoplasticum]